MLRCLVNSIEVSQMYHAATFLFLQTGVVFCSEMLCSRFLCLADILFHYLNSYKEELLTFLLERTAVH